MKSKTVLILCLFFMFTLGFASQNGQSVGSGDYVIFRANIAPMYIENESIAIQVLAVPFQGNKPIAATCTVHVEIKGLNINYTFSQSYQLQSGRQELIYLVPLKAGHYEMILYASYHDIQSKIVDQDFGVTQAPVPYDLTITDDGSTITFQSLKLNETGVPDPEFPFTIQIYLSVHGSGEALVRTYTNVTNLTIHVPDSWKIGILYVEVVDVYGWHNGASVNLAQMQFAGIPLSYDYEYAQREPYKSRMWQYIGAGVVLFFISLYVLVKFSLEANKTKGRRS